MKALWAGALLLFTSAAGAHEWYPTSCCSGRDCMAVPLQAVTVTPDGYVVEATGELIPWGDPRIKPTPPEHEDGTSYHWCRRLVAPHATICLFVPGGAS